MRIYHLVRAIHQGYPLAVFWCYVGTFFLALSLIFIFPPGTIVLLWLGLVGLAAVVIVHKIIGLVRLITARVIMSTGSCPACGCGIDETRDPSQPWRCAGCDLEFLPSGAERLIAVDEPA